MLSSHHITLGDNEVDSKVLDEMLSKHFVALESKNDSKVLGEKSPRAKNVKNAKNLPNAKAKKQEVIIPQKTLVSKQLQHFEKLQTAQTPIMESIKADESADLVYLLQDLDKPKAKNPRAKKTAQQDTNEPKNLKNRSVASAKKHDIQSKQTKESVKTSTSVEFTRAIVSSEVTESSTLHFVEEMSPEQIVEKIIEATKEHPEVTQNTQKGVQSRIARDATNTKESKVDSEQKSTQGLVSNTKDFKHQGNDSSKQNARDFQSTQSVARSEVQHNAQEDFQNDLLESLEQGTEAMQEFELGREKALNKGQKATNSAQNETKNTESKQVQQNTSSINTTQKAQISQRASLARESIKNFAQQIRDEVKNYKPPITRILLELHPQNLGTVELTISKRGKDLVLQVLSNQNAISLFSQNQAELRTNLNQMGFENVDMSFSTPQDSGGEQNARQDSQSSQDFAQNTNSSESESEQGNKNGLNGIMEITIPQYA